ncbi:hypothetical protein [Adonisia turfae]|uniref:Uncharacterized protein n=1 Tax=Adonisia turfae CCMR0081 TaxID=2292702 RepID=A0A6M0REQ2_9CYAN|nr:hypothetical protein [Adonisia turfae]NEZ54686.1 hypothetical protein [Adonisia turfae CCMR0081]
MCLTLLDEDLGAFNQSDLPIYSYFGEKHCDVIALLKHLSKANNKGQRELARFTDFINSSVIVSYKTDGELFSRLLRVDQSILAQELCGLGLYFPKTEQDISRYSSLALYQSVDLVGLYKTIFNCG